MPGLWSAANGYMATPKLSSKLRHAVQPLVRFRQFCDVEEAIGKNAGETYQWNVYGDTNAQGGSINETEKMPETNFSVTQNSVTVGEYGIAVPYSGKFDDLSEHPVTQIINKTLKNDARRALDTAAHAAFDATPLTAIGGASGAITLNEDGSVADNTQNLTFAHVKTIADTMEERNIPTYDGEHYMALARPSTLRPLKNDLEAIHQYTSEGWHRIMNGEKGKAEGIRFCSQTNIASEAWAASGASSDAAYFFGADTVTEAIAIPEEIRGKIPDDYGRSKGIAWYALLAFGLTHPLNGTDASQCRIIKWAGQ